MKHSTAHRWVSRKGRRSLTERVGATTLNLLMRHGRIHAKKLDGKKVLVDLNSIDDLHMQRCRTWEGSDDGRYRKTASQDAMAIL